MKRRDREDLQRVLWYIVMWVAVIFFAFAAGVKAAEWEDEPEQETLEYTLVISEPQVQMAAMPIPATQAAQEPQLDVCEETYLRDDIPLSYELQALLYGACLEFEIDFDLALAVIEQETNFRNVAGDSGDSQGYMQIQRKWWKGLMAEIGAEDLTDPEDNFRTGCAILRQLMDKYGNIEDALSAYNTGRPGQTRYSREVMEKYYG